MVEFRQNKLSRDYVLMEINGRFWGSLPLAVRAGLDFPYLQWQVAHDIQTAVPQEYQVGLRMRWTAGEIQRFLDLMTSSSTRRRLGYAWSTPILQFAQSFDPRVRSALFSAQDPLPEINDVASTLTRALGGKGWHLLKCILPASFVRRVSQLRCLDPQYRKKYLSIWLLRVLRSRHALQPAQLATVRHITLVCRANRIRSPIAAAMLQSRLNHFVDSLDIQSAGTQSVQGSSFDPRIRAVADEQRISLTGRPKTMTQDLVRASDLLVVMDRIIEAELLTQFPQASPKVFLLSELVGSDADGSEITDPDRDAKPEFARFISRLAANIERLAAMLSR